ncbi:hypothetical protein B9Q11_04270 [Candidatus Marsarchaeota G2 archaeon ECH_B_SAG-F08]|jgi:3-dehydroquinate synthase II|uniref:3-dehydroquinate synthase n=6 Tax=Candidatus Marsarchaeota TaxID=1978152 RepID=A0A2R6AFY8_9ARCH|nr:MAG: hypothetical protein B9Q01_05890 [Candidatus Marsarchaeota G1 archaeon OSP_D]PSN85292.1 MAG: hypothetical protein B9Q02_06920 [Candidatus Marsarchaeota G1 archaeon BE_D]PSN87979.1 MAG: hypothetical protein B9Q00_07170 [Candidatus Marsarchaeota G1 archaeon OSP_C]PSN95088.1 MAG: hypothetical protein B9P99_01325 [Candidatus Marsarchaeota G1 archaeon OSP_B]PSN97396.1 MAG: hypothetical protein B9Q11_04270 [Candidatus Marsarchaeota G2 archaeon ECH_B_SAG-F08]PSO04542.1 MAG: hypothetical prote
MNKEIFIKTQDKELIKTALSLGFKKFYHEKLPEFRDAVFMHESANADITIDGKNIVKKRITGAKDIEEIKKFCASGTNVVIVETTDWTVIPYENLIVEAHLLGSKVFALTRPQDIELLSTIMEKGVDGLVIEVESEKELEIVQKLKNRLETPRLVEAFVKSVDQCGLGERVCVDTVSILKPGEGLLVGNTADFLFLVHNENIETEYARARPFRINAGAVHSYFLKDSERTGYLCELHAGEKVLVVSPSSAREVSVGRVKIESRPLALIRAKAGEREGSVMVQWAETIRLVKPDGKPISVTELKSGDKVLVWLGEKVGRHFGAKVEEFILER